MNADKNRLQSYRILRVTTDPFAGIDGVMHDELLQAFADGGGLAVHGWTDDIVRNELFAAAIESCPVGVSISDATKPSFPFLYVNSAFSGITGHFPQDVIGRRFSMLHGPDTDLDVVARLTTALLIKQPVDVEIVHYRKDGSPFWCELRVTPLTVNGRVVALISVHTDITDRRQRQIEDQRRQKLQALGQLAGGVAHELNNLLQPILSYTDLVLAEIGLNYPLAAKRLDRVLASAEKARDIVRGILRFSRGEGAELVVMELHAALAEAIAFVRGLLPVTVAVNCAGLEGEFGPDLGYARINAVELTQVFSNLLTNAAHAMEGRGTVTIEARVNRIAPFQAFVLGVAPGRFCVITVCDTGPGMDETVLAHLFDPFFTTKPIGQGTGLGLSVVYGILQNWRGAISVKSEPGSGAHFTLYIPIHEAAEVPGVEYDQAGENA